MNLRSSQIKVIIGLLILPMITGFVSCKAQVEPTVSKDGTQTFYGEKIDDEGTETLDEVIIKLKDTEEIETKITGTVTSVCKKKGCWMTVESETGEEIFVKFKDYGFFMPLECEGQEVIMRGKAFTEVTSVDELKHYAEDEGKSQEEIDQIKEPISELKFMSDGVILLAEKEE